MRRNVCDWLLVCPPGGGRPARLLAGCAAVFLVGSVTAAKAQVAAPNPLPIAPSSVFGDRGGAQVAAPVRGSEGRSTAPQATAGQSQPASTAEGASRRARQDNERQQQLFAESVQDVPSEFQRLVADSIGSQLPIFGANLFNKVPTTFAPVDDIPVTPDYAIGPGDELRIQVYGQVNREGSFVVDRTGNISFPDVGTIHVAGVRYAQLGTFLKSQLSRVFRNFELNVNLGQLRSIQIFVVGSARRPGSYTVSSLSTLLNALFASGGPLPQGSLRDLQLRRGAETVVHFDLYDLLLRGDKSHDVVLAPGDVLFIPPVGPQVAVAGSVNTPAIYEIRPGDKVADLIAVAGGETSVALGSKIRIDRIFDHSMRSVVDVDLGGGAESVLANGDIVQVGTILGRYKDALTLRGNVAYPGRYVWHPGMRLTDLVRSRDDLITREYYRRRNALGTVPADYTQSPPATLSQPQPGSSGSLQLRGTDQTRQADSAVRSGSATASSQGGNSVGAALTDSNGVFPATTDVVLSAPDLDWNYGVIERLDPGTLETSLIAFHPGKLYLDGDQTENLLLQPGDVVTFFSTADIKVPTSQQTRFVRLEGEFLSSGVYSVQPGETLRHLLARAGGFTADAYLYGSEFTRQSTRRLQQQRLNEYADNLEAQVSLYTATSNARAISDRDANAAAATALESRETIARLRRLVPVGRIVLALKPDDRGVASVPDLPLEDGDRFVVPRVPSTVNVEGQVYSANAFVFERGRKERDYVRFAGGPDREADRGRMFILRADGSVYSRQYGNVARATIFPGDTVVVPPQLDRRALLRNLLDISSIVGQFGLGAAAINILK